MSDYRQSKKKQLTPSDRQRSIGTRSPLISRGLELVFLLRQEKEIIQKRGLTIEEIILPARKIKFPADWYMGMLSIRRWNNQIETREGEWKELGPAQGEFDIPEGVELMLNLISFDLFPLDLSPLSTFGPTDLQRIGASHTRLDDEGMECLQNLTGLLELWIMKTEITDNGLRFLQKMSNLRILNLSDTRVTDDGIHYLAELPNLCWLFLDFTRITDAVLEHLKGLINLKTLTISFTQVTDVGLAKIRSALPNCSVTNLEEFEE